MATAARWGAPDLGNLCGGDSGVGGLVCAGHVGRGSRPRHGDSVPRLYRTAGRFASDVHRYGLARGVRAVVLWTRDQPDPPCIGGSCVGHRRGSRLHVQGTDRPRHSGLHRGVPARIVRRLAQSRLCALPRGCPPRRNALADHLALRSLPEVPRAVHAMVLGQQSRALFRIRSPGGAIRALVLHPNFAVVCLAGAALGAVGRVAAGAGRIEAAGTATAAGCGCRDACDSRRLRFCGYALCVASPGAAVGACGGCGGLDSAARRDND